jgi:hypothetical protein
MGDNDEKSQQNVDGNEKPQDQKGSEEKPQAQMVPKSRLDDMITKRNETEKEMNDLAETFVARVPEEMRSLIPDLPAAKKIKWINEAEARGIFDPKPEKKAKAPDAKRPAAKKDGNNYENMSTEELGQAAFDEIYKEAEKTFRHD